jgi:hypothetical protein
MAPPHVPVLGGQPAGDGRQLAQQQSKRQQRQQRRSPSPTGWGDITVSDSPEPDLELGLGSSTATNAPPAARPQAQHKVREQRTAAAVLSEPVYRRSPVSQRRQPDAAALQVSGPVAAASTADRGSGAGVESDQRAKRHRKELRLAQQQRQRKPLSQPGATIPSPRVGLCVITSDDPAAPPVRSGHAPAGKAAVARAARRAPPGPPTALWVDQCSGLVQGLSAGVSATQAALERVGLAVRSYTDERAALSWATHHVKQVACAVLHIQLASTRSDRQLIENCATLKIPTLVLQLVPPGHEASGAVRGAMDNRLAFCRKLRVAVASELNEAQAKILQQVSENYEFGPNGQLQRLAPPPVKVPPWQPPRADKGDKMPPVNGAQPMPSSMEQSQSEAQEPRSNPGARRRGNKHQYHLAPSNRGAGAVCVCMRGMHLLANAQCHAPVSTLLLLLTLTLPVLTLGDVVAFACCRSQVEYTYGEFRSVDLRQEQMPERPPKARHEGAQIVTKNNRGEPSWSRPQAPRPSIRTVGAMRVAHPTAGGLDDASTLPPLPPMRTKDEAAQSRRRLYADAPVSGAVINGATMKDLRSRFPLPSIAPESTKAPS